MTKQALSVQDVANLLSVSVWTIYRMMDRGELLEVRVGKGARRVSAKDLKRYLNEQLLDSELTSGMEASL